jgi:hypothetical protein
MGHGIHCSTSNTTAGRSCARHRPTFSRRRAVLRVYPGMITEATMRPRRGVLAGFRGRSARGFRRERIRRRESGSAIASTIAAFDGRARREASESGRGWFDGFPTSACRHVGKRGPDRSITPAYRRIRRAVHHPSALFRVAEPLLSSAIGSASKSRAGAPATSALPDAAGTLVRSKRAPDNRRAHCQVECEPDDVHHQKSALVALPDPSSSSTRSAAPAPKVRSRRGTITRSASPHSAISTTLSRFALSGSGIPRPVLRVTEPTCRGRLPTGTTLRVRRPTIGNTRSVDIGRRHRRCGSRD